MDRVSEELWTEVCDIVQEVVIKTIPKKKKPKRQNGCLRKPYKQLRRREVKGKGEKERYIHLNAEFQRITRRDKKAFLGKQCKEIEENNRMGKTRDLFKKIRDTKGTFHAKMGTVKDRSDTDLIGAEDIKKRWQEYTEELYKKNLHDPDNHDGVITHLEPDILECEVRWALGRIPTNKASGGDGISADIFQILKDDAVKSAAPILPANLENSAVVTGLEKVNFNFNPKERQCQRIFKLPHMCTHRMIAR